MKSVVLDPDQKGQVSARLFVLSKTGWITFGAVVLIAFLVFFHLSSFPLTWFDEGSHLHVPKTLVTKGVYADYSSEGFRYYGPTSGVGPTVFLPIAMVFSIFGIGLFQARMVAALYLVATLLIFYRLAKGLGGITLGVVALALVITSRGVDLLQYGREVLGEVPGLFFLLAGLWLWFYSWKKPSWWAFAGAGALLGLSLVTVNQYLILIAPGLGLAFLANLFYYKAVPQRAFVITGALTLGIYLVWLACQIFFLGPSNAAQNWALFRQGTTDAALIFSPALMKRALTELLNLNVYLGVLLPGLVYGAFLSLPRRKEGLQWGVLFLLVFANLLWYVTASISWSRYAFPGLAISSLFVGKLFLDLIDKIKVDRRSGWESLKNGLGIDQSMALKAILVAWLGVMVIIPLAQDVKDIAFPPFNAPAAMAAYMNDHVSKTALVETWEPEMGFLTNHNYHFPPPSLLYTANSFIWLGKTPPSTQYDYVQQNLPDYVLVGAFSSWVQLYPVDFLNAHYHLEKAIGGYQLYQRNAN